MTRRDLLSSSLAISALVGLSTLAEGQGQEGGGSANAGEFYELRRYQLRNGPEPRLIESFLREAALPALNRAGVKPVGVFHGMVGPENPSVYVLVPFPSLDSVAAVRKALHRDEEYLRLSADYLNAPATEPAYVRFETRILESFESFPRVEIPPSAAEHRPRIFELRTYENPSEKANLTKLHMFNTAEIAIFRRTGLRPVFFGNTVVGNRMPCLTYMLTFESLAERERNWRTFGSDPEWRKLSRTPGYTDPEIVSNISNLFLSPAPYSQI
ncbi:MAG: NIPSNAP family protein [Terriglobia bacterium]